MAAMALEELYEKYVKPLPARDRLRLLSMTAADLCGQSAADESYERSLLDFEGIAKHNPVGMDAQEYVRQLRSEWDHRP